MEVTYNKNKLPDLVGAGDMIVGSYNESGATIKERGVAADGDDAERMRKMFEESMARAGGSVIPEIHAPKRKPVSYKEVAKIKHHSNPAKIAKPKRKEAKAEAKPFNYFAEVVDAVENEPVKSIPINKHVDSYEEEDDTPKISKPKRKVEFSSEFGKIRLFVEDVLECDMAFALVFAEEEDIVFIPKPGQTLVFKNDDGFDNFVYYPDALFTLPDGLKRIMILFKSTQQEDNE